ncbi:MAG: lytic transglycosylase domain-containing protein [Bacteroidota bacterium]
MNRLLLLATFLICLTIQSKGATFPDTDQILIEGSFNNNDSTGKQIVLSNPKDGFKNLFEAETSDGINIGKLNPRAISFVEDYMVGNAARLAKMKSWGRPYFDLINDVLTKHGLPVELKYLSVIESDLKSSAVSWAGAVGPWQFMPGTARDLGLTVNSKKDERRDYFKSTHAAAEYLTDLYALYGDWLLVIAAYNGGPGNVNAAIRKSRSRNFWDLQNYLPAESRNHVKKFIATHYIMEGSGGMTTLTKTETANLALPGVVAVDSSLSVLNISGKYLAIAIAGALQMNITDFNRLNPNFDKVLAAKGTYDLRLSNEKMILFSLSKSAILQESVQSMLRGTNL